MPLDKQKLQQSSHQIEQSLAMISSLRSNIEHHLPGLQNDLGALQGVCNLLAEEIGQFHEVFASLCRTRFQTLLPNSGVNFDPPAEGEGIKS